MSLQTQRWKMFFSRTIYENISKWEVNYRGMRVTATADATELLNTNVMNTANSIGIYVKPLQISLHVENLYGTGKFKKQDLPFFNLMYIPVLTPEGFKLTSTRFRRYKNFLAPATGWYIVSEGKHKTMYYANSFGKCFTFKHTANNGVYVISSKSNGTSSKAQIPIYEFLWAVTGKNYDELDKIFGNFPSSSMDSITARSNNKTYEEVCADAFALFETNVEKRDAKFYTVPQDLKMTIFSSFSNANIEKVIRFKHMESFHRFHRDKLIEVKDKEKFPALRDISLPTDITMQIATLLDESGVQEIVINHKNGKVRRNYTIRKCDMSTITTQLTPEELIEATYDFYIHLEGMGKEHDCMDLGHRVLQPIDVFLSAQIDKALNTLRGKLIENISLGNVDCILRANEISHLCDTCSTSLITFMKMKEVFAAPDETNSVASNEQDFRLVQPEKEEVRQIHPSSFCRICPVATPESNKTGVNLVLTNHASIDEYHLICTVVYAVKNGIVDRSKEIKLNALDERNKFIVSYDVDLSKMGKDDVVDCMLNYKPSKTFVRNINYQRVDSYCCNSIATVTQITNSDGPKRQPMSWQTVRQATPALVPNGSYTSTGFEKLYSTGVIRAEEIIKSFCLDNNIVRPLFDPAKVKIKCLDLNVKALLKAQFIVEGEIYDGDSSPYFEQDMNPVEEIAALKTLGEQEETPYEPVEFATNRTTFVIDSNKVSVNNTLIKYYMVPAPDEQDHWYHSHDIVFHSNDTILRKNVKKISGKIDNETGEPTKLSDEFELLDYNLSPGYTVNVIFKTFEGYGYEDAVVFRQGFVEQELGLATTHVLKKTDSGNVNRFRYTNKTIKNDKYPNLDERGLPIEGTYLYPGDVVIGRQECKGYGTNEWVDSPIYLDPKEEGRVINVDKVSRGRDQYVSVTLSKILPLTIGDKISGFHGNKSVVSVVIPDKDMPYFADGSKIDMIFNPLGITSRENVGQTIEGTYGAIGKELNSIVYVPPYTTNDTEKLADFAASKGVKPKTLYDAKTGEPFPSKVFLHTMTIIRSTHVAFSKFKACSQAQTAISETTLQTQNSKSGGQRISEMTVADYLATGARKNLEAFTSLHADDYIGYRDLQTAIANCKVYGEEGTVSSRGEGIWYQSDNANRLQAYLRTLGVNMVSTLGEDGKQITYYEPLNSKSCCDLTGGSEFNTLTQTSSAGDIDTKLRSLHFDGEMVKPESKVFNSEIANKYHNNYGKMRVPGDHRIILPFTLFNSLAHIFAGIDYGNGVALIKDLLNGVSESQFEIQLELCPKMSLVASVKPFKTFNDNFIKGIFNIEPKFHYFYGIIGSKSTTPVTISNTNHVISGLFVTVKFAASDWTNSRGKCVAIVNHLNKVYCTTMIDASARNDSFLEFFKVIDPRTAKETGNIYSCYNPVTAENILKLALKAKMTVLPNIIELDSTGANEEVSSIADSLLEDAENLDKDDDKESIEATLSTLGESIIDEEESRKQAQSEFVEESMDDLDDDAEILDGGNFMLYNEDLNDDDDEFVDDSELDDSLDSDDFLDEDFEGIINRIDDENAIDLSSLNTLGVDGTNMKNSQGAKILNLATRLATLCKFNDYYKDGLDCFFTQYVIIPPGLYRPYSDNSWSSALGALVSRLANTNDIVKFYAYLRAGSGRVDKRNPIFPDEKSYASIDLIRALARHTSKKCILRDVILVKRIMYTGRSVIYNNPKLRLGEIELPVRMLTQIFSAHIRAYLNNYHNEHPILEHIVYVIQQQQMQSSISRTDTASVKVSNFLNEIAVGKMSSVEPYILSLRKVGLIPKGLRNEREFVYQSCYDSIKKILEHYSEIYPVEASRDPALHQHSIGCFRFKLVDSICIGIHPLVCHSYNADFDGDQMSLKFQQFKSAIDEAGKTYVFGLKPISCASGESIIEIDKDMLLGIFYATTSQKESKPALVLEANIRDWGYTGDLNFRNKCFIKLYDYLETEILKTTDTVVLHLRDDEAPEEFKFRTYISTVGRILFNSVLTPDCFTTLRADDDEVCSVFKDVYQLKFDKQIKSADLKTLCREFIINFKIKNDHILEEQTGPFVCLDSEYGEFYKFFDRVKDFGFYMADISGTTLSVWDFNEYCLDTVQSIKPNIEDVSGTISTFYELGCLTDQSRRDSKLSIYKEFDNIQTQSINDKLNHEVNTNLYNIVKSGARGNVGNLKTICLSVGVVKDSKNREQELPIMHGFLQGLNAEEGLQNSVSARRISIQTYRKAPDTGARSRMMTSMVDHLVINNGKDNKQVLECGAKSTVLQLNYTVEIADLNDLVSSGTAMIEKAPLREWDEAVKAKYQSFVEECQMLKKGLLITKETLSLIKKYQLEYVNITSDFDGESTLPTHSLKNLANYMLCKYDKTLLEGDNSNVSKWSDEAIENWNSFIDQLDNTDTAHVFVDTIQTTLAARGINRLLIEYVPSTIIGQNTAHYQERVLKYKIDPIFDKIFYNRIIDVENYYSDDSEFSTEIRNSCFRTLREGKTYYAGTDATVKVLEKYRADRLAFFNLLGCEGEPALCPRCFGLEYDTFNFPKKGTSIGYLAATSIGEQASQSGFDVHKGASLSKKIDLVDSPSMAGEEIYMMTQTILSEDSNKFQKIRSDLGITKLAEQANRPLVSETGDGSREFDSGNVVSYVTLGPCTIKLIPLSAMGYNSHVLVVMLPKDSKGSQPIAYGIVEKYNLLVYDGQEIDEINYEITRLVPTYKIGQVDTILQRMILWKHYIASSSKLLPRNYEILAISNVENGYVLKTTTSKSGKVYYAGEVRRVKELKDNNVPYRQQMVGRDALFNNNGKVMCSAVQSNFMSRMSRAVIEHTLDDENSTILQLVRGDTNGVAATVAPISCTTEDNVSKIHIENRNSSLLGRSSNRRLGLKERNRNRNGIPHTQDSGIHTKGFSEPKTLGESDSLELDDAEKTSEF